MYRKRGGTVMYNGIIIATIVVTIALGYKTKINTGLFGMILLILLEHLL